MARLPKPDQRHHRELPKTLSPQLVSLNTQQIPKAPADLSSELLAEWQDVWSSSVSASFDRKTAIPAIRRLFRLRQQAMQFEAEALEEGAVSTGSTGQRTIHPLSRFRLLHDLSCMDYRPERDSLARYLVFTSSK